MLALIFDTETTGKWDFKRKLDDPNQPDIVQLAFRFVNLETKKVLQTYSAIIQPHLYKSIDPEAEAIHGVSLALAQEHGISVHQALKVFVSTFNKADMFVCHNTDFDFRLIKRTAMLCKTFLDWDKPNYCTMRNTTNICQIPSPRGYKWPKLIELHNFLFGVGFEGAHDALVDVLATERCLFELYDRGLINKAILTGSK